MSAQNRTALKALITGWPETNFDLIANHKPTEQHILDSVLLNRDVLNTIAATGTQAIDFTGYDTIVINQTDTLECSVTGISNGEVKYLIVNKVALAAFEFIGSIIDTSIDLTHATDLTLLMYRIVYKGGVLVADPVHASLDLGIIPTPEVAGAWQQSVLTSPWLDYASGFARPGAWYRKNRETLEMSFSIYRTLAYSQQLLVLPVGFRPLHDFTKISGSKSVTVYTTGQVFLTPDSLIFIDTIIIPLT